MGLFRLTADKVAYIFGVRVSKRLRGKLHSVLEKLDHGHHVLRIYCKNLVGRMYEKFSNFLRVEVGRDVVTVADRQHGEGVVEVAVREHDGHRLEAVLGQHAGLTPMNL